MKKLKIISLLIILTALGACSQMKQSNGQVSNSAETKKDGVNVPRNLQNSVPEPNIYKESSAIVTLPNNTDILYGAAKKPLKLDELGKKFEEYEKSSNDTKVVYVVADSANDYASLVKILDIARKQKINTVRLVVSLTDKLEANNILEINLPYEPKENMQIKPNPLTLLVTMDKDGKFKLNQNDETLGSLTARLAEVFRNRAENGVFREGTNEVEQTVFVKAPRSAKYGEVAKIIDALKGVYANPIGLQIDDLND